MKSSGFTRHDRSAAKSVFTLWRSARSADPDHRERGFLDWKIPKELGEIGSRSGARRVRVAAQKTRPVRQEPEGPLANRLSGSRATRRIAGALYARAVSSAGLKWRVGHT
jgi:hypothetical protein